VPSQGSDRLKAILAEAKAKASAAQAAGPTEASVAETQRVEALLDRNEALPDPRALSRLYRSKDLVERLPEDEDSAPATPGIYRAQPGVIHPPPRGADAAPTEVAAAPEPRADEVKRPPLSPAQIREVVEQLKERFGEGSYTTYEPKALPVEVIPSLEEPEAEVEAIEEPREIFYIVGTVVALVVIGVFVLLALNGPLRYRPPAGPSPSPTTSR
jgi:hypothetical protein